MLVSELRLSNAGVVEVQNFRCPALQLPLALALPRFDSPSCHVVLHIKHTSLISASQLPLYTSQLPRNDAAVNTAGKCRQDLFLHGMEGRACTYAACPVVPPLLCSRQAALCT